MMISSGAAGNEIPQGLGTLYKMSSDGSVIDCDSWSNLFQGVCWNPTAPEVAIKPGSPSANQQPSATGPQAIDPNDVAPANTITNKLLANSGNGLGIDSNDLILLGIGAAVLVTVLLVAKK